MIGTSSGLTSEICQKHRKHQSPKSGWKRLIDVINLPFDVYGKKISLDFLTALTIFYPAVISKICICKKYINVTFLSIFMRLWQIKINKIASMQSEKFAYLTIFTTYHKQKAKMVIFHHDDNRTKISVKRPSRLPKNCSGLHNQIKYAEFKKTRKVSLKKILRHRDSGFSGRRIPHNLKN